MVVLLELLTSDFPGAPGRQVRGACCFPGSVAPGYRVRIRQGAPDDRRHDHADDHSRADDHRSPRPYRRPDDDRIIGLIQERVAVSAVVQETRIASGGRRVSLTRENEILRHYSDALGKPGTALAMTLLELSRGRI